MLPVLLRFQVLGAGVRLSGYGFCVLCGAFVALVLALRRAREQGLPTRSLLAVFLPAVVFGFAGARFASWIQCGGSPFRGGLVLYGGLLSGALTAFCVSRWKGLSPLRVADLAIPCVLLGAAFGRLGCFFAGCCYGTVCDGGMSYPRGSHAFLAHAARGWIDFSAAKSLPTVPAPLLESIALLLISAILSWVWRRRPVPGTTLGLAGLLYPAWRFGAEFWRGDNRPWFGSGMTFSQGVSVAIFVSSIVLLAARRRSPPLGSNPCAEPVPWRFASLLPVVLVAASGVTCMSTRPARQEMAGEWVIPADCHSKEERQELARKVKKEAEEVAGDCIFDCIGDCIGDCISACIDSCCEGCTSSSEDGPSESPAAPRRALPGAGGLYEGRLTFEVLLNQRLEVLMTLQGVLQVAEIAEDGRQRVRMIVNEAILKVGESRSSGKGTIEVDVLEGTRVILVRSDLPREFMESLKSLERLLGDLVRIDIAVAAVPALRERVEKELALPEVRIMATGDLSVNGTGHPFRAAAEVIRLDSGERRVRWSLTR